MSYHVIKTINGIAYVYEQSTFRVGGKVRTDSKFVRRASPNEVVAHANLKAVGKDLRQKISQIGDPETKKELRARALQTRSALNQILKPELKADVKPDSKNEKRPKIAQETKLELKRDSCSSSNLNTTKNKSDSSKRISNGISLKYYGVSEKSLLKNQEQLIEQLEHIGVDVQNFPKIRLSYSKKVTHEKASYIFKSKRKPAYVVTLPRGEKGNRTKFRDEFLKATALGGLDLMQVQQPDKYQRLAYEFDQQFQNSQNSLNQFIINTTNKNRIFQAMVLKWWGNISYLKQYKIKNAKYQYELKPSELGLRNFEDQRKDWRDDCASIMVEIQKKGFERVFNERSAGLAAAIKNERRAVLECQRKRRGKNGYKTAERRMFRQIAKAQTQRLFLEKLQTLNGVFQWKN